MNRKKSREIAMEQLFSMILSKNTLEEAIEIISEELDIDKNEIDVTYIVQILSLLENNKEAIDNKIESSLDNWKLERISKVNLAILRLALVEMFYLDDVPGKVAINEAIELTKKYSDEKSVSFVNGVLDKVFKSIEN